MIRDAYMFVAFLYKGVQLPSPSPSRACSAHHLLFISFITFFFTQFRLCLNYMKKKVMNEIAKRHAEGIHKIDNSPCREVTALYKGYDII